MPSIVLPRSYDAIDNTEEKLNESDTRITCRQRMYVYCRN